MQNNNNQSPSTLTTIFGSSLSIIIGIAFGITLAVLEIVGLVVAFTKGVGIGIVALFIPPFACYLGFKKIIDLF